MLKSLPHEVIVAMQPHEPYDVIYWMLCDRSLDGEGFASTYLILSKEKLFVVSFPGDKANVESIDIDNIETAFTVNLIASGIGVLQEDE
ncbi:ABC transporter, partial [Clostridium perfringens]